MFSSRSIRALAFVAGLTAIAFAAPSASADTVHVVGRGETIFWIAKRYRVTPEAIRGANSLREKQLIHPGLSLTIPGVAPPKEAATKVKPKEKDSDGGKGAKGGKASKDAKSDKGDKGAKDAKSAKDDKGAKAKTASKGGKNPRNKYTGRPKKPGFVTMTRGTEKLGAQILTRGQLNRAALPGLTKILRHVASDAKKPVDPRLAYLIGLVSDHFAGKTIHVVSGFRPFSKKQYTPHSNHNLGRAMDFAIEGVPNTVVRDFCRTLRDAGCGYYPNSSFVHMDVRTGKAYWIDYSGPGEAPRYDGKAKGKVDESTRDVEGAEEGGSAQTQQAPKQPADSKTGNSDVAAPQARPAKQKGLRTPTPQKTPAAAPNPEPAVKPD